MIVATNTVPHPHQLCDASKHRNPVPVCRCHIQAGQHPSSGQVVPYCSLPVVEEMHRVGSIAAHLTERSSPRNAAAQEQPAAPDGAPVPLTEAQLAQFVVDGYVCIPLTGVPQSVHDAAAAITLDDLIRLQTQRELRSGSPFCSGGR